MVDYMGHFSQNKKVDFVGSRVCFVYNFILEHIDVFFDFILFFWKLDLNCLGTCLCKYGSSSLTSVNKKKIERKTANKEKEVEDHYMWLVSMVNDPSA